MDANHTVCEGFANELPCLVVRWNAHDFSVAWRGRPVFVRR